MATPPLHVPELPAGPHYALRPWRMADLDLVREASLDPVIPLVTTVPAVYSKEAGTAFVERQWGRPVSGAGWPFVIVRACDGRAVGTVGLWPDRHERASLGYWVVRSARERGAALAGLRAVTDWALDELGLARLELYVEPWNAGSIRTAERAGYRREGLLRSWQKVGDERREMFMYALLPGEPRG
jgi:[ribosomal protein S5]-alanine N-acetyltransferase